MHYGYLGSVFSTQDRDASEGAMVVPWSGRINMGAREHDTGHLSLLV